MTIHIHQSWDGEEIEDGISPGDDSAEVAYRCYADADETRAQVLTAARDSSNIPHTYEGLQIRAVSLIQTDDHDRWNIIASYGSPSFPLTLPQLEVGDIRVQVQSGNGGTARRTFSRALISETLAPGVTVPTLAGTAAATAVGIVYRDGDFEIEGVDVPIGGTSIQIETTFSHAQMVTGGHQLALSNFIDEKAVNSDTFLGYPAGCLRVDTGSLRPQSGNEPDWDVVLNMEFSQNLTNISVGNGITVPAKLGHHQLDVLFTKDEIQGLPIPVPKRAAVHEMFPTAPFNTAIFLLA